CRRQRLGQIRCAVACRTVGERLGKRRCLERRVVRLLVEPSVTASDGDTPLLAAGLPGKADTGRKAVPGSIVLKEALGAPNKYARGGRSERLACIWIDSVGIVIR